MFFTDFLFSFVCFQRRAKGSELANLIAEHLNLLEKDYFGLTYLDQDGNRVRIVTFPSKYLHYFENYFTEINSSVELDLFFYPTICYP